MHETTWNPRSARGAASPRPETPSFRNALSAGRGQDQGITEFCRPMGAGLSGFRRSRSKTEAGLRSSRFFVSRPKAESFKTAASRPPEGRILHGRVDPGPCTPEGRRAFRRTICLDQCLENTGRLRLVLPETGEACPGTGRESHRSMDALSVAAYKKKPKDLVPTWSFLTKAASFFCRTWSGPGLPKVKLPNCVVPVGEERFRLSPPSVFPPEGAGWRFMRGFTVARISNPRRSRGFSSICSSIFEGLSCFFGIPERRTKAGRLKMCSQSIRGFRSAISPDMPRSSTRRNMSGATSSMRWPTAPRRICGILSGLCIRRFRDCANPKSSSGDVFMVPVCPGLSVSIT